MSFEGATIHTKCGGTGIIDIKDDGTVEVCPECMGSGVVGVEIEMGDHHKWIAEV
ncbi:TPA: hypothetical protein QC364_000792 [Bacillus cereus]|uniref:hypothetical protein n=1 Tax=Bacillus paranthracis TaxID=2026186 RepID=UPI0032FAE145|nr:hypothetical protein [Bacillus cereus]